ncbi:MAG: hypothetical protein ABIO46_04810 [Chitinophagales bacterium]
METTLFLPLEWKQLERLIIQLTKEDKQRLHRLLLSEDENEILTHYASEASLSKEWKLEDEQEAWKNL